MLLDEMWPLTFCRINVNIGKKPNIKLILFFKYGYGGFHREGAQFFYGMELRKVIFASL